MASTRKMDGRAGIGSPRGWVLAVLLGSLGFAAPAQAAVRYAEPAGDGPAATCPQSDPCDLDTAVENGAVVDTDEVVVTPGTYSVAQLVIGDAIDLHGEAGQPIPTINTTSINGISIGDAATVRDLRTVNSSQIAVNAFIDGATIERVSAEATQGGAISCSVSASVTVRDAICHGSNATNTAGIGSNTGISGSETIRLRNITAIGSSFGIRFSFSGAGVNVLVDAKNVIADGPGTGDVAALSNSGASTQVVLENSNYATQFESTGVDGLAATVTDPGPAVGNQTASPVFAGPGDFHQDPTSPTVDAGQVDAFLGTGDFEGQGRVLEGNGSCPTTPDIGADELFLPAIDCDPPETSMDGGPMGTTGDTTPTFDLVSDEPSSTFECRVDGGAFSPCGTPFTTATLTDGSHTVEARATDQSGNTDPSPASRTLTVDTTPPETTITGAPKAKIKTKKKRVRLSFSFAADEAGTFECSLDGDPFSGCSSPFTARVGKGLHSFEVRATDATGNADQSPDSARTKVKRKRRRR